MQEVGGRWSSKQGMAPRYLYICMNVLVRFHAGAVSDGRPYRVDVMPASTSRSV
jgi:hypothetical protein